MPRLFRRLLPLALALLAAAAFTAPAAAQRQVQIQTQWLHESNGVHAGQSHRIALRFNVEEPWHVQSNKPADEYTIPTVLTLAPQPGITIDKIIYPDSKGFTVAGFDEPVMVFDTNFIIGIMITINADVAPGTYPLAATLDYQACDNSICLQPADYKTATVINILAPDAAIEPANADVIATVDFAAASDAPPIIPPDRTTTPDKPPVAPTSPDCDVMAELNTFKLLGSTGGYLNAADFIAFIDGAEAGTLKRNAFEGKGPIVIILIVIVGGVLLNLTPCVLPLIPINLAIIGAGSQAGSRARGFALGGAYGFAMAVVYGALGLIVTLTSSAFGTINSTIWFNVAIAILFVFLALAMFDVIAIDFTKYQSNIDASKVGKQGSLTLAFFMGCVTALLAGACVAPVVIQVIVYAGDQYAKGITIALALPFFLGLGMALPWPFAGAGLSLLPKPGMWMVRVKQAMGVFILIFAAYYAWLAYGIWDSKRVDPAAVQSAIAEQLEGGWHSSICAAIEQAKRENKPLLIDMWATWCKNCLAMDRSTFKDQAVIDRLDGFVKVKFQAEDLESSPAQEMLQMFEGIGLPTYAVMRPSAE